MSLDEALDQLVREARDQTPPEQTAAMRLQQALDELVREARQWAIQTDLLQRRRGRRHVAPAVRTLPSQRPTMPTADLNAALDELARHAVAARAPAVSGDE